MVSPGKEINPTLRPQTRIVRPVRILPRRGASAGSQPGHRLPGSSLRYCRGPATLHGTGRCPPAGVRLSDARGVHLGVAFRCFQAHRQLRSRSGRFLLYPVIAILVLASLGGGYKPCARWRMQRPLQHWVN
jgi:hypothetical protein